MTTTSPMRPQGAPEQPWYRHRWPWLLMLGPLTVVIAGGFSAWLAFTRPDALVVGDYYLKGKAINQDLRRARAASGLQLAATLRYDADSAMLSGSVSSFGKAYGVPLVLHLAHATLPEKDIRLELRADANGKFSAALPAFGHSRWQVLLENTQRDWRLEGDWIWPKQRSIELRADAATAAPGAAGPAL
jgi:hypothetical protein